MHGDERALRELDHAPPVIGADAVIARARRMSQSRRRMTRVAVGAGTILAATLAAALPSARIVRYLVATGSEPMAVARQARVPATDGITVTVTGDAWVEFRASRIPGDIRIAVGPGRQLRIAQTGRPNSAFVVTPRGVTVDSAGSGAVSYAITLPASSPHARVLIGTDTVFASDSGRITTAAAPDGAGGYTIHFAH